VEVEEVVAAPEVVEVVEEVEEVVVAPEIVEDVVQEVDDQAILDNNRNFNVIDATNVNVGQFSQTIDGTSGDDLILTSDQASSFVDAGAGDDVVVLERGADLVNLGAGQDTVVVGNNGGTALFGFQDNTFEADDDILDFSRVPGVNNFDDITINLRDDLPGGNEVAGLVEVSAGNSTVVTLFVDEARDLDEDNFVFAGDDDAFVG